MPSGPETTAESVTQTRMPAEPAFDSAVPPDGYRWWYIDGISDDGRSGIVIIGFVGSVFSPYYFRQRRRRPADAENHCAINVGLYGTGSKRWAMTERGRRSLSRSVDRFRVGPSEMLWHGDRLEVVVRERSAPAGRRVVGRVVVEPAFVGERAFELDAAGHHVWQPLAPRGRIAVEFDHPALAWQGHAYFDSNSGARPLERDFRRWHWSRASDADSTSISYVVTERRGGERGLALTFDRRGGVERSAPSAATPLPASGWRIRRDVHGHRGATLQRTLEDTPFYARSLLTTAGAESPRTVMHESLDLDRFRSGWVQLLLPFRMPRRP